MNGLGTRIKALREERALLQKQVAEKAGLTASKVSQIESGRLTPSLRTLGKLAHALGVSIPELLEPPGHGESVAELQKRKILVDGKAGALLLQIFSENQLGPIFFEFIERKGDEGFGEGNFRALFESIELDQMRRGVLKR